MNRRKKINQIVLARSKKTRAKKSNARLVAQGKPKYVSKADRAKLAIESSPEIPTNLND